MARRRTRPHGRRADGPSQRGDARPRDRRRDPGEVLTRLDRLLIGSPAPATATAATLRLDLATGEVDYAAAGHPYGLLRTPTGEVTSLDGTQGRALGVAADSTYPVEEATLGTCGTVLLYTDGLVERRGENLDRGIDRRVAVVDRSAGGAARLVHDVIGGSHTAVERDDDVCVLAASRT